MKIVYLLSWSPRVLGGVEKKVACQVKSWREQGHEVQVVMLADQGASPELMVADAKVVWKSPNGSSVNKFVQANKSFAKAGDIIKGIAPDLVYYRLSYPTPSLLGIASRHCMIVELNNNVIREMRRNLPAGKLVKFILGNYLKCMFRMLAKRSSGLVAVTHELAHLGTGIGFDCPQQVVPNGINMSQIESLPPASGEGDIPVVAFLGSSEHPKGLERLLKLAEITQGKLEFRMFCKNEPTNIPSNVKYFGFMEPEGYVRILEECDIGLSTLCLYEKGLREACSLKVREYLARGLPVVVAHEDTALSNLGAPWHLKIDNDEANVENCHEAVVDFAQRMRGVRVSRDEVIDLVGTEAIERTRVGFFEEIAKA